MEAIESRIKELESKLTGKFFDDHYVQESINYWKRHLNYEINKNKSQ